MKTLVLNDQQEEFLAKAVENFLDETDQSTETTDEFSKLNSGSRRLVNEWGIAFSVFEKSLIKNIQEVLRGSESTK